MTIPIKELRAKAEAATRGERYIGEQDGAIFAERVAADGTLTTAVVGDVNMTRPDIEFTVAASPDVVLALLDECDRLSALHDELLKSRSEGTRLAFEMADAAKSENDRLRALLSNPLIDVALGTLASDVPPYDREPHTAELRAAIRLSLEQLK